MDLKIKKKQRNLDPLASVDGVEESDVQNTIKLLELREPQLNPFEELFK
jgi:hypothetical protein